jgi:uncharacterized surface protein with fasciclin (FAS1) repeats
MIGTLFIFPFQLIAGIIKIDFLTLPVLTSAVKAAGMVETLSSKGPFMLFAPNESVFAKVQNANLDAMLKRIIYLPESFTWTLRETASQEPRHTRLCKRYKKRLTLLNTI